MELNLTIMEQCYVILLRKIYKKLEQTCREVDEDYGFESDPEFDQEMLKSLLPIACMELGCPNQVATKISPNLEDVPPEVQEQFVAWAISDSKKNLSYPEFYRLIVKDPNNMKYYEDASLQSCYEHYKQYI